MALRAPLAATAIVASLLFAESAALAADPASLGRFRDWEAFEAIEQGHKVCYALTSPQDSQGAYTKRDPALIMVTRRPNENVYDEVSAIAGYTYQPKSTPVLQVGSRKFSADPVADVAWPRLRETPALVAAMKAGSTLLLVGTSARGTLTKDQFSLLGFTAAMKAIAQSCPKR